MDPLWQTIRAEVEDEAAREPLLASFLYATVLNHKSLEDALSFHLAGKLESPVLPSMLLRELFSDASEADPGIGQAIRSDLQAIRDRDPAAHHYSRPFLFFKGFHAIQAYRFAHWLWTQGREALALFLQSRVSEAFAVDIHPAARIGNGIMVDHATGLVVGETAVVEDNVRAHRCRRSHPRQRRDRRRCQGRRRQRGAERRDSGRHRRRRPRRGGGGGRQRHARHVHEPFPGLPRRRLRRGLRRAGALLR
jgi:hypothetical protein